MNFESARYKTVAPDTSWSELTIGLPKTVRFPSFDDSGEIKRGPYVFKPDHLPCPSTDVAHYIQSWHSKYLRLISALADQMEPLQSGSRLSICIPVAGAQEQRHIFRCLESFADQTLSPECYDIHLLVNYTFQDMQEHRAALREMYKELARAKESFPHLRVYASHLQTGYSENMTIGLLRSIATDVVVFRKHIMGDGLDHILARCDADTRAVKRTWAATYLKLHNRYPHVDSFMGSLFWSPEQTFNAPVELLDHTLFALLAARDRIQGNFFWWAGPNVSMRMSSYAYLGGYDPRRTLGEDIDLLQRTIHWREPSTRFVGVKRAGAASRLFSSTRRSMTACKIGLEVDDQWSAKQTAFSLSDHEIRAHEVGADSYRRRSQASLHQALTDLVLSHTTTFVRTGRHDLAGYRALLREALGICIVKNKHGGLRSYSVDGFIRLSERAAKDGPGIWKKLYHRDTAMFDPSLTHRIELVAPTAQIPASLSENRGTQTTLRGAQLANTPGNENILLRRGMRQFCQVASPVLAASGFLFGSYCFVTGLLTRNAEEVVLGTLIAALSPILSVQLLARTTWNEWVRIGN